MKKYEEKKINKILQNNIKKEKTFTKVNKEK